MDPIAAIGATGVMDLQKLAKWFADSRLDPNDPNNANIVYMLRVSTLTIYLSLQDMGLQTMLAQIRLLLKEQSDLGLQCLLVKLSFTRSK